MVFDFGGAGADDGVYGGEFGEVGTGIGGGGGAAGDGVGE